MRAFSQAINQTPMYSWLEAKYLLHIQNKQGFNGATYLKVEIMSDAALELWYSKLTVSRTDAYMQQCSRVQLHTTNSEHWVKVTYRPQKCRFKSYVKIWRLKLTKNKKWSKAK